MECIDLNSRLALFEDTWSPRIIAELNGQHVKLAKLEGEFTWHAHQNADELFLVLQGEFTMQFRDRSVVVGQGQIIVVPRGVEHRPIADSPCAVLLVEPAGLLNTGDGPSRDQTTPGTWI